MPSVVRPVLPETPHQLSAEHQRLAEQPTVTLKDALILVAKRRNIGPDQAEAAFFEACASGKVSPRHLHAFTNGHGQKRIAFAKVPRDAWGHGAIIDVEANCIVSFYHGKLQPILISETELSAWLSRPRRGPAAGTLARFAAEDRKLFASIEREMLRKNVSLTEAVRELDCKGMVKGRGTSESRIRRVTRLYKNEQPYRVR